LGWPYAEQQRGGLGVPTKIRRKSPRQNKNPLKERTSLREKMLFLQKRRLEEKPAQGKFNHERKGYKGSQLSTQRETAQSSGGLEGGADFFSPKGKGGYPGPNSGK